MTGRLFVQRDIVPHGRYWLGIFSLSVVLFVVSVALVSAQEVPTTETVSQSNNPLADLTAINFNDYYSTGFYNSSAMANVLNLQLVLIPVHHYIGLLHLIRATLPIETVPTGLIGYSSGIGDFVIQDAFKFSKPDAKLEWGIGPLFVLPTATSDALGAGKWQAGVAAVVVLLQPGGSVIGGGITWQISFAGEADRPDVNLATFQETLALAIGTTGFYISSSPIWMFDFENDRYLIPFSVGVGKVFIVDKTIINVAMEPQVTVYHKGEQQPTMQLFFGMSLQWK